MNQKDLNRLSMWKAVQIVLKNNEPLWLPNVGFAERVLAFNSFVTAADAAAGGQLAGDSTGITLDKQTLAENAVDKTLRITKIARAYARLTDNQTLYTAVDGNKGSLYRLPYDELTIKLTTMLEAAMAVGNALFPYGYGSNMGAEATVAINAFEAARPATRVAIASRASMTSSIPEIMRGGKIALLVLDDLIILYEVDQPDFVTTYKNARSIIDYGIRHQTPIPPAPEL